MPPAPTPPSGCASRHAVPRGPRGRTAFPRRFAVLSLFLSLSLPLRAARLNVGTRRKYGARDGSLPGRCPTLREEMLFPATGAGFGRWGVGGPREAAAPAVDKAAAAAKPHLPAFPPHSSASELSIGSGCCGGGCDGGQVRTAADHGREMGSACQSSVATGKQNTRGMCWVWWSWWAGKVREGGALPVLPLDTNTACAFART
eukprot:352205-Chlamydomonas_euryale.AAC.9